MAESIVLTLGDLEGVSPIIEKRLHDAGIESVLELAITLPEEIAQALGVQKEKAYELIYAAQTALMDSGLLEKSFLSAFDALERRKSLLKCTTGSKSLDSLLKGGVETQAITELWGEYGSGKTQLCHTLCVTCQLSRENGGLEGNALYIDTESTFRPERLYQIAEARGLDPAYVLKNTYVCRVYNSSHLEFIVKNIGKYIEKYNIKLVIVDSVISLYRGELTGRETLAERQQRLNKLLHRLLRVAEIYNVAVVVTNQVQSQPDMFFGDPNKPSGGNVMAHSCTYRIYLKKIGQDRKAVMIDSPYHPYSEATFSITDKGVVDVEDKRRGL
ncbi:MAG: DNA repair and recombination protein RadA [Nitrososphaeria archaeon]